MAATDSQVQQFVDQRIRPRCEATRLLLLLMQDDIALIDDVYASLSQQSPTWADARADVPHALTPGDVLAINSFLHDVVTAISGNSQLPIVRKACVKQITE